MTYIKNSIIVTPDAEIVGKVLAFDDKISGIIGEFDIPDGADIIDAEGGYTLPGLIDIHIHGYLGEDSTDGIADGLYTMANGIVKNGVTSFLPTTMTVGMDDINSAFDAIRSAKEKSKAWDGAEILGVHAEGPFINPAKKGAQPEEHIISPYAEFILNNTDIVKVVTIAPEMDKDHAFIKEVSSNSDVLISIGHTEANYDEAMSAIKDGAKSATHLFNTMPPLSHRAPGVIGAALTTDIYCELIADTFHIHPGLFPMVAKLKGDKLILITDCMRAGGLADGNYTLGGQDVVVRGIECRMTDGTIAGSVLALNAAVRNMIKHTDVSVHKAVNMASLAPAKAIHVDGTKGSLETGKDADICITDKDFNVIYTIRDGKIIYKA